MKKLLLCLLFASLGSAAIAQNSFFVDKKGEKTVVKDGEWDIIVIDKRISYKLPGKTWEKYIKFEDMDYGVFGPYLLKSYIIDKKKKVLFVQAQSDGKSLASLAITTETTNGHMVSSSTYYQVYVLDGENNVLDKLDFKDAKNQKSVEARGQLSGFVKKHFGNCAPIISAVDAADTHDEKNLGVLEFLQSPIYRSCD